LRTRVKICGITRVEDLIAAVDAGADAVGFVVGVPSSARNLSLHKAKELVSLVPVFTSSVLVMVPNGLDNLIEAYEMIRPDTLQLHGEGLPCIDEIREKLPGVTLIRGIRYDPRNNNRAFENLADYNAVLLDTFIPEKYGGTGVTHDWQASRMISEKLSPMKLILAGGLNPSNVQKAIQIVNPYAVDVSTGVESSPGLKDSEKMRIFVKRAHMGAELC
jgi:phosphoribosylanthranilate isomerase